ncbi:MAG: hypothetical protein WKF36_08715 [Candidatus Nitrosocosmicus sp.]
MVNEQNHYFINPNKVTTLGKCIQVIDGSGVSSNILRALDLNWILKRLNDVETNAML